MKSINKCRPVPLTLISWMSLEMEQLAALPDTSNESLREVHISNGSCFIMERGSWFAGCGE
ncbi:hypothetical protein GYH30_023262 [Glycine max]|nr:hypothetical protein GYH30_023262 [Glycine max]